MTHKEKFCQTLRIHGIGYLVYFNTHTSEWEIIIESNETRGGLPISKIYRFDKRERFIACHDMCVTIDGMVNTILEANPLTNQFRHIKWERGDN